jgi:hypothetical protein
MMNPEIKARWVAWLRVNANSQGKGFLRDKDDRYCCLGGLCELAVKDGVIERWLPAGERGYRYGERQTGRNSTAYLPLKVVEWAGLEQYRGAKAGNVFVDSPDEPPPGSSPLAALNDSGRYDFHKIAYLIEEYL